MPEGSSESMSLEAATVRERLSPWRTGPLVAGAAVIGAMLAGTIALWAHYGTAVFFEMVRTGFMSCFG
jgi:hypothetical protein